MAKETLGNGVAIGLAVVAGLDVAGEELGRGVDLLDAAGEGAVEGVHRYLRSLAEVDAAQVGFGDVDLDPELRGFEEGEDDLVGGDEVAGADADGFDGGVGGGDEVGFARLASSSATPARDWVRRPLPSVMS